MIYLFLKRTLIIVLLITTIGLNTISFAQVTTQSSQTQTALYERGKQHRTNVASASNFFEFA